jgi:tetratricopeptide (TPR) repeat protein
MEEGHYELAQEYLHRAEALQPTAFSTRSLKVVLMSRMEQDELVAPLAKELLAGREVDYELVRAAFTIGERTQDWPLAIRALQLRLERWPSEAVETWLELGTIYAKKIQPNDARKALFAYREALKASPGARHDVTLAKIPYQYRAQL